MSVAPSPIIFPFAIMLPTKVETPVTFKVCVSVVPSTVTPSPVVANFSLPL